MKLPVQSASTSRWQVQDFAQDSVTSDPAAGGRAVAAFEQVPDGELWMVERIVVTCTSTTPTEAQLYNTEERPAGLREFTPSGNQDVADMASPLQVRSGEQLLVIWVGASDASRGTGNIQYTVLRRTKGAS